MKALKYIAKIQTDFPTKFGIPRQSGLANTKGTIVFEPEYRKEEALKGLEECSHLWLIWEFSEAVRTGWSPTVRPPRLGGNKRCGVFATRSPFRPNPIGLSCVKLTGIKKHPEKGMVIEVEGADARGGFADVVKNYALEVEIPEIYLSKLPEEHRECVRQILAGDPRPSYQNDPDRVYGMEYAGYEIKFRVKDCVLTVCEIGQSNNRKTIRRT